MKWLKRIRTVCAGLVLVGVTVLPTERLQANPCLYGESEYCDCDDGGDYFSVECNYFPDNCNFDAFNVSNICDSFCSWNNSFQVGSGVYNSGYNCDAWCTCSISN